MSDKVITLEESMDKLVEDLEDPDEAIRVANRLLSDLKEKEPVDKRTKQGRKRHPGFGLNKIRPLEGVGMKVAGKIRQIVGLRYSGHSDSEIERVFGWTMKYISKLEARQQRAFQQAREELLKAAVMEYNQNVSFARAALSESGFLAVDTLTGVMDNKKASNSEKLRAAELVLKLTLGSGHQSPGEMAGDIISSFGAALKNLSNSNRVEEDYIHDAEVLDVEAYTLDN